MISASNNVVEYEKFDGTEILFNTVNAKYICVRPEDRALFDSVYHRLSAGSEREIKMMQRLMCDGFVNCDETSCGSATKVGGRTLHITIMPTENCNFRCIYCFEQHKTNFMSEEVQKAIIQSVDKIIGDFDSLFISWYGGEPLMYMQTIEYLSEELTKLCARRKKSYMASITTNGYNLTYENYLKLRSYNVADFTITIDGIKEDHNHYRKSDLNGGDTYSIIIENLKQIKEREKSRLVHFTIRTNFTKRSVANKPEWDRILDETFLHDDRFTYLPRIAWNGSNSEELKEDTIDIAFSDNLSFLDKLPLEVSKGNEAEVDSIIPYEMRSSGQLKKNIETELEAIVRGSFICGAGYKSTMTVSPEGDILKCQVNLREDYNAIGRVNIENGEFEFDAEKSKLWNFENVQSKCRACGLFPCCKGIGCPLKVRGADWCDSLRDHILRRLLALTYCNDVYTEF